MPAVVRPSPLLVRLVACAALVAIVAVPWPPLLAPAVAFVAIVSVLALTDWIASRRDPAPLLDRVLSHPLVRGRSATATYRLSRSSGAATMVSLLDELPADLGGDLIIEGVRLAAGECREVTRQLVPLKRGARELGPTFLLWRSWLGLFRMRATVLNGAEVAIMPPASMPERRSGLTHRSLRDELGMRPRPARGEGTEFESLREYVHGDDPRHIDWRASARRGHLIVRQHQTERRHTVIIAVDTGRLMAGRVGAVFKLDYALDCAIALARASREFGDQVGFLAYDREIRMLVRPKSGLSGVGGIVEATLKLNPSPFEPNYRVVVETLARFQKKRALIVVLTDFVEGSASRELESYVGVLARRHCVLLVALRDRLLVELDEREPAITRDRLYRRLALQDLVVEREAALARIGRLGAQVLDLDPARVTAPVLNRYLAIRQAALL